MRNQIYERTFRVLIVVLCIMQLSTPSVIFAQNATKSAEIEDEVMVVEPSPGPTQQDIRPVSTGNPVLLGDDTLHSTPSATPLPTVTPFLDNLDTSDVQLLINTPSPSPSGVLRQPVSMRHVSHQTYQAGERVRIIIDNASIDDVTLALFGPDGEHIAADFRIIQEEDPLVVSILPRDRGRVGTYRVTVATSMDGVLVQDFSWGVLAMNLNKSIYTPDDTAHISLAVLDSAGYMVCDAALFLEITDPDGEVTTLTTDDGSISVNPVCALKEYVDQPDFETAYQVSQSGVYQAVLRATTTDGSHVISDSFEVRDSVPFDVERMSQTRIFPPVTYPMKFVITAAQDFEGDITETIPGSFAIAPLPETVSYGSVERVVQEYNDAYVNDAPVYGLVPPFDQNHPISLFFGQQLRDPVLKTKYKEYGLLGHDGVDFDMPVGTPVLAADDGVVVKADEYGDYGMTMVLEHSWGRSYYGHLSQMIRTVGDSVAKGYPIALSGNTGLSTGPHLHFGIKPTINDIDNGYYGKIDPLPFLTILPENQNILDPERPTRPMRVKKGEQQEVQEITWHVVLSQGQTVTLGYQYQVPNISPQFYLLGPLTFADESGTVFSESRTWQLAIDADGSGTNSVNPTTGTTSQSGQTYTFTFTAAEAMSSGGFTISVPSGWSTPQTSSSTTAGYTTATGNGSAVVAIVEDVMDSATGWSAGSACSGTGGLSADASVKQEGTASIKCVNGNEGSGDVWYKNISSENWSSYTHIGIWLRADKIISSGWWYFAYDDSSNLASPLETLVVVTASANTWQYQTLTFGSTTRTAIISYGFQIGNPSQMDNVTSYSDYFLLGPSNPTVSGSGPWTVHVPLVTNATSNTVTVVYGANAGGGGGVTNSATPGVHTFTTQSRISVAGTLTNIAASPTVTLSSGGPTMDQLLRHGAWFSAGVEQPFTF